MRRQLISFACSFIVLASGCPAEVDTRDNPFDPEGTNPAPAILDATFLLVGATTNAGISVELREGPAEVVPGVTDDTGNVRFLDLAPGSYRLRATFAGYAAYERSVELSPAQELILAAVELEPRGSSLVTIVGQVEVEGAAYHGGVLVRTAGAPYSTVSAADGSFTLSLPPGSYDVELETRDHQPVSRPGVEAPADLGTIVLPILPHTILVDVQRSVCGAAPPMEAPAEGALVEILSTGGAVVDSALVDALGAASLLGVPGGRFDARISLAGYRSQTQSFEVHDGQTLNLAPVILEAQRGGIVGTVSLENATSFAGTVISLQGTPYSTITSESGAYALSEICGGTYDLIATTTRVGYLPVTRAGAQVSDGSVTTIEPLTLRVQTGGFTLNAGNPYTATVDIPYDLTAPVGTTEMRISEDTDLFQNPARSDEGWVPYFQAGTVTLGATEGMHTVQAQTRDAAAVVSTVLQASVTVDTTPPVLDQVQIDIGSGFSNDAGGNLILQLTGSDLPAPGATSSSGVAWVRVFDADLQACAGGPGACPPTPADWLSTPVEDFRVFLAHIALRPLADEEKEVWVRLGDAAGNWGTPLRRNTTLDRIAPAGTSITAVGSTPGYSSSSTIVVQLAATDLNPVQVRLANDTTFAGAIWRPFVDELTWFLASGDGGREVWVEFRDVAGNLAGPFSDSLTVDTVRPTASAFSVVQGGHAPSENLTLDLATTGGFEIRIDEDGNPGAWQPVPVGTLSYVASMPAGPGGTRTVNLLLDVRDQAHNTLTTPRTVSVVVDRDAPADPSVSVEEGPVVTVANVTLQVAAETGPTQAAELRLTLNSAPQGWIPFAFRQTVSLVAGVNTLGVEVRDLAGNVNPGGVQNVSVEYDTAAPTLGAVSLESGATWTNSRTVSLVVPVTGGEDVSRLQLRTSTVAGLPGAPWGSYASPVPVTLEDREGLQTVHVEVRDAAGLVVAGQDDILLDRVAPMTLTFTAPPFSAGAAPAGISIEVLEAQAAGTELAGVLAAYPEDPSLGDLDCGGDAAAALASALPPLAALNLNTSGCLSTPCLLGPTITLPSEGRYRLQTCFRDAAGNAETQPVEVSIIHDATPPDLAAAPVLVGDGRQLTASWAALADAGPAGAISHYELQVDTTPGFGAGTISVGPIAASETSAAVGGLDNRMRYWVRLRAVDPAGNARDWVADPPPSADVLVGMRAVNLSLTGGPAATDPAMASVGSTLWVASGDLRFVGYGSEPRYRFRSCDLDSGQCGAPSAWREVVFDSILSGQMRATDLTMVASGRNLWVAAVLESPQGRGVELHGCSLNTDCLDPGNWTSTVLEPINSNIGPQISLAEDGGVLRLAFVDRAGFLFPGLRSCAEARGCNLPANWSPWTTPLPTGTSSWAINGSGALEVLAENAHTLLVWDKIPSGGPAGVAAIISNGNDRPYDLSTWGNPALVGTSIYLDSAVRLGNQVYLALNDLNGGHSITLCDFGTLERYPSANCGFGWGAQPHFSGAAILSKVALGTTVDGMHATWWSEASQSLEYGFCRNPRVQSCTNESNWRFATLRDRVFENRRPFPASNGADVVVAGKNDQGSLSVHVPIVPGPRNPTGALGDGLAGIGWDPSGTAAGYDFLSVPLGAAPFGEWTSEVPIPDPLRSRATIPLSPGAYARVGVRTRSATGGLSDDSQIVQVRALQNVKTVPTLIKVGASAGELYRAVAGVLDGGASATLRVEVCDWGSTECQTSGDWVSVDLVTFAGIKDSQVKLVGDELWVTATYSDGPFNGALAAWACNLETTAGCTKATDFQRFDLVPGSVLFARLAVYDDESGTSDRVGILYYDQSTGQERLTQCLDGPGDCKLGGGTWTDDLVGVVPPGLDGEGGHDLILDPGGALIAYVPTGAAATVQTLSVAWCSGAGPFSFSCNAYTFPQQVQWESGAVRVALRRGTAPVILGAYDRTLHVFTCSGTPDECTRGSADARWSEALLDAYFYLDGHALTVGTTGYEVRVLYQLDGQFTFASCRERCDRNDSWRRAKVHFDLEASPESVAYDAGWWAHMSGDFGLVVPGNRAVGGIGTNILTGGEVYGLY